MADFRINVTDIAGNEHECRVNKYPQSCPICHHSIAPEFVAGICRSDKNDKPQAAFRCTQPNCGRLFIANYHDVSPGLNHLGRVEPVYARDVEFPEPVKEVSPMFVEIYKQAMIAESQNLDQLTGIGLRKALEFLVKDYAASTKPEDEKEIKKSFLSKCIKEHISDTKVKSCAERASWLGNDETHYIKKWGDKDINDLKILIKLTVNWIESSILTEQYSMDMRKKEGGQQVNGG